MSVPLLTSLHSPRSVLVRFRCAGWEEHPAPSLTFLTHFYFSLSTAFSQLFSALEKWRKHILIHHEMVCNFFVVTSQQYFFFQTLKFPLTWGNPSTRLFLFLFFLAAEEGLLL